MKILMKIEVAKKQNYIFSSNKLIDNISNSNNIVKVTSNEYFMEIASDYYTDDNLVYSGGGHTVLQFNSFDNAVEFAKIVTLETLKNFDGLELFCTSIEYDSSLSTKENLMELSKKLEYKKSFRNNLFDEIAIGVENLSTQTFKPKPTNSPATIHTDFYLSKDIDFPKNFEDVSEGESFIAVVHIDGNAMGKRIEKIYEKYGSDFNILRESLNEFSKCIQSDFEKAFRNTIEKVDFKNNSTHIRPVILAGDDVCFITKGSIGNDTASIFLTELSQIKNEFDGTYYSACAGVAIVHKKFPFYKAYNLSEELCDSAKKFSSKFDEDRGISAIDWHIEYGQIKGGLSEIREDYICDDDSILNLRPYAVVNPNNLYFNNCKDRELSRYFEYTFFSNLCTELQGNRYSIARGKIKELRQSLKQGVLETDYFLINNSIKNLKFDLHSAIYGEDAYEVLIEKKSAESNMFIKIENTRNCLLFDAIEMMDIYTRISDE